jgi:DNA-binding MarR family transcriptional regulator
VGNQDADAVQLPAALMASTVLLAGRVSRLAAELVTDALAPLGLRARHYSILMALAEHGPASQHNLGKGLLIDRTTMVSVVDDLERLGLVMRAADPQDRRAYRVELTGRGRTSLVRATGAVARAERNLLAGLSVDEQGQLRTLLRRVVEHVPGEGAGHAPGSGASTAPTNRPAPATAASESLAASAPEAAAVTAAPADDAHLPA